MTRDETKILRDHGERLVRIETELTNHVRTSFTGLARKVEIIDSRLWWILGTVVLAVVGIVVSLVK